MNKLSGVGRVISDRWEGHASPQLSIRETVTCVCGRGRIAVGGCEVFAESQSKCRRDWTVLWKVGGEY